MWQKVLHFDCRSKIRGSIPPYLLSLCWPRKCQPQIFVWFFFYFLLILISSMVEQDTSNIQIQVQVLDKNRYFQLPLKEIIAIYLYKILTQRKIAPSFSFSHETVNILFFFTKMSSLFNLFSQNRIYCDAPRP